MVRPCVLPPLRGSSRSNRRSAPPSATESTARIVLQHGIMIINARFEIVLGDPSAIHQFRWEGTWEAPETFCRCENFDPSSSGELHAETIADDQRCRHFVAGAGA